MATQDNITEVFQVNPNATPEQLTRFANCALWAIKKELRNGLTVGIGSEQCWALGELAAMAEQALDCHQFRMMHSGKVSP